MNFTQFYKSHRSLWKAILVFKLVSGFLVVADQLSIRFGLDGSQPVVDDLLGGLIAGFIFYFYERHRLRRLRQQLQVIDLMNHHARNALQPLMFMIDEPESRGQMKVVEDCVRRIDWVLGEVLPGKSEERFSTHDGRFVRDNGPGVTSQKPRSAKTHDFGPPSPQARRANHCLANGSIPGGAVMKEQVKWIS
jgi:hypothetical protein